MTKVAFICDFCASPGVRWSYPARSFPVDNLLGLQILGLQMESGDLWAACEECHKLIRGNDKTGLAVRCTDLFQETAAILGISYEESMSATTTIHQQFFQNRRGAPEPFIDDEP